MSQILHDRLNQIPEKILSENFLRAGGLSGEIGFWVFDYDPSDELKVREYTTFLQGLLADRQPQLKVAHINLLQTMVDYLGDRRLLEKAIQLQQKKGDKALVSALSGALHMDKFAPYLADTSKAADQDIILISGVGSVWPLIRAHNMLNSLHSLLGHKPVVLFYPGEYTGQAMSLFGKIPSNNYYRAFKLVP